MCLFLNAYFYLILFKYCFVTWDIILMLKVPLTVRPEALRKLCHTHAVQIVKHCNNGLNVRSKHVLDLITSLTALLLQVRLVMWFLTVGK